MGKVVSFDRGLSCGKRLYLVKLPGGELGHYTADDVIESMMKVTEEESGPSHVPSPDSEVRAEDRSLRRKPVGAASSPAVHAKVRKCLKAGGILGSASQKGRARLASIPDMVFVKAATMPPKMGN